MHVEAVLLCWILGKNFLIPLISLTPWINRKGWRAIFSLDYLCRNHTDRRVGHASSILGGVGLTQLPITSVTLAYEPYRTATQEDLWSQRVQDIKPPTSGRFSRNAQKAVEQILGSPSGYATNRFWWHGRALCTSSIFMLRTLYILSEVHFPSVERTPRKSKLVVTQRSGQERDQRRHRETSEKQCLDLNSVYYLSANLVLKYYVSLLLCAYICPDVSFRQNWPHSDLRHLGHKTQTKV